MDRVTNVSNISNKPFEIFAKQLNLLVLEIKKYCPDDYTFLTAENMPKLVILK